jgi:hypothetical protein
MKKPRILTLTVTMVFLITSLIAPAAFATTIPTFTLSSSGAQLPITLPAGTTFNGSISTTGTIRFWVNDPNGIQIVNMGLIDNSGSFGFVAAQDGNYTLNFENDLPNSNPIQVTFSYTTNPEISSGNSSAGTPTIYLVISVIIAIVGSILIILFINRKGKKQASIATGSSASSSNVTIS